MTPQELKHSILQLAIQGKLVPQDPSEGTGEELYRQIQEENGRLIKKGVLKKAKYSSEISLDDCPFDIPDSWCFVRFSEIGQLLNGEKKRGEHYPILDAKFLRGKAEASFLMDGEYVEKGAKLILVDGENSGEVFDAICAGYMGSTFKVLYYSPLMCDQYVLYFLLFHKSDYRNNKKGSAIPHLNKDLFFNMPMPLPPLAEQKRIVAKIEELLPLIDRYGQAYSKLEDLNKRFPLDLQKSILQLAMQGKLVPQDPSEGTGEELYRQIQTEKDKLIKEGKIKKEKPLANISDDEIPFEIPESWRWVSFFDVACIASNLVDPMNYQHYMHIAPDNIEKCTGVLLPCRTVKEDKVASPNHLFYKNQLIYSKIRPLLRKAVIAPFDGLCSADMYPIDSWINTFYLKYVLLSDFFNNEIAETISSRVKMPKINQMELGKTFLPLPPLAEQKRIVEAIERLLPLCDKLKRD